MDLIETLNFKVFVKGRRNSYYFSPPTWVTPARYYLGS